jgi:hypothetical protein
MKYDYIFKTDYNPWTNKEITPIKVLDMAPLIMVTLPTVSSFFSTCGCFLRDGRSPSRDLPSLSSLCMASRYEWLSLSRMAAPPGT